MNPENQANRPDDINPNATAGSNPSEIPRHIHDVPYDNTSLDEKFHEKVKAGESILDTGELTQIQTGDYWSERPPAKELPAETKNKSKKGLFIGIGGVAAGAVALGVIFMNAGAKDNENKNLPPTSEPTVAAPTTPGTIEPTEQPTVVATPTPTDIPTSSFEPTPTPVETTAPSVQETEKSVEYSASDLKAMPLEQFNQLSLDTRLILVDDMLTYGNEMLSGEFGEGFGEKDTSDLYNYNPLNVASPDNSLEDIVMQQLYIQQLALLQTDDANASSVFFSPDRAAKGLSGAFITPDFLNTDKEETIIDTPMYGGVVRNMETIGETVVEYPQEITSIDKERSFKETVTGADGKEYDTATVVYYLDFKEDVGVAFPKGGHIEFSEKYVYHTYETPSGDEQGLWLTYESQSFGKVK